MTDNVVTLARPRTLFLHIGSDKTGSTALQTHITANRELLRRHGIYIPRVGRAGALGHHGEFFRNLDEDNASALVDELDSKPPNLRVLMSWEGIQLLGDESLARFAAIFANCPVHIIYYIREQADLIQSGVLQQIKTQEKRAAALFADAEFKLQSRDYYRLVKRMEQFFPGCSVDVVYYDRNAFPRQNIVYDFFSRLTNKLDIEEIEIFDAEINPSLGVEEVRVLAALEDQYPELCEPQNAWKKARIIELLMTRSAREHSRRQPYFLCESQVQACRKFYRACNTQLVAEYGVSDKLLTANKPAWNGERHQSRRGKSALTAADLELLQLADTNYLAESARRRYHVPLAVLLVDGWSASQEPGSWLSGRACSIRGAISLGNLAPPTRFLRIEFGGEYASDATARSEVWINGESLGSFDLSSCSLLFPVDRLAYPYIVQIDIRHAGDASTGADACYRLRHLRCATARQQDAPKRQQLAGNGEAAAPL